MRSTWDEIKREVRSELPGNTFSLWISPLTFEERKDRTIILTCPNEFSRSWVMENYIGLILEKLDKASEGNFDLGLKVKTPRRKNPVPYVFPDLRQLTLQNWKRSVRLPLPEQRVPV